MAKYIVKHRRGTAAQWAVKDIIPQEGELVIEIDEVNNLHKLKIGDGVHAYSDLKYLQAGDELITQVLPRVITLELAADKWQPVEGKVGHFSQALAILDITPKSRLDLQPSVDMLAEFTALNLIFVTENKNCVITVYSIGNKPSKTYKMQATIVETEVVVEDITEVVGTTVVAPAADVVKYTEQTLTDEQQAQVRTNIGVDVLLDNLHDTLVGGSTVNGNIKIDGVETVVYTHPDKHSISDVTNLQDTINAVNNKFENYVLTSAYTADKTSIEENITHRYTKGEVDGLLNEKVSTHNTAIDTHNDIRLLIEALTQRLNTVANSDDINLDQLSEIVAYIKNNKSLIEGVTTNKVNVSDIVDNLTTNVVNKPLSAAQGVAVKTQIDGLQQSFDTHEHNDVYYTESEIDALLTTKANLSHGEHVTYSESMPLMNGTASAGTSLTVAHSDHRHPIDTSRASASDLSSHIQTHAPINAQANVIETIKVNGVEQGVTNKVVDITMPTKVSDLENDEKYLTQTDTYTKDEIQQYFEQGAEETAYLVLSHVDVAKADKATTLAGYNIADAYTKTEVDGVTSNIQAQLDGKAEISHGTHVPTPETANNAKFLRNDNTWQAVTPANIGAATSEHNHDDKYYTESEIDAKLDNYLTGYEETDPTVPEWAKAPVKPTYTYNEIIDKPTLFSGDYNDLNNIPSTFEPGNHDHNDQYYTETEIDNKLNEYLAKEDVSDWAKADEKPTYNYSEIVDAPQRASELQLGLIKAPVAWTSDIMPVRISSDGYLYTNPGTLYSHTITISSGVVKGIFHVISPKNTAVTDSTTLTQIVPLGRHMASGVANGTPIMSIRRANVRLYFEDINGSALSVDNTNLTFDEDVVRAITPAVPT